MDVVFLVEVDEFSIYQFISERRELSSSKAVPDYTNEANSLLDIRGVHLIAIQQMKRTSRENEDK